MSNDFGQDDLVVAGQPKPIQFGQDDAVYDFGTNDNTVATPPQPKEPSAWKIPMAGMVQPIADHQRVLISKDGQTHEPAVWDASSQTFRQQVLPASDEHPPIYNSFTAGQVKQYAPLGEWDDALGNATKRSIIPTAAGVAAGKLTTTALSRIPGSIGELMVSDSFPGIVANALGFTVGSLGGSAAVEPLNEKLFGKLTPEQQINKEQYPIADWVGGMLPSVAAFHPNLNTSLGQRIINAGMMEGIGLGTDLATGNKITPGGAAGHAAAGFVLGRPNKIGRLIEAPGAMIGNIGRKFVPPKPIGFDPATGEVHTEETTPPPAAETNTAEFGAKDPVVTASVSTPVSDVVAPVAETPPVAEGSSVATEHVAPLPEYSGADSNRAERTAWFDKYGKTHWIDGSPRPPEYVEGTPEYVARKARETAEKQSATVEPATVEPATITPPKPRIVVPALPRPAVDVAPVVEPTPALTPPLEANTATTAPTAEAKPATPDADPVTGKKLPQGVIDARKTADALIAAGQGDSAAAKNAIAQVNRWEDQNNRPKSYQTQQGELGQQPVVQPTERPIPAAEPIKRSKSIQDAIDQAGKLEKSLAGATEKDRPRIERQLKLRRDQVNADDVRNGRKPTYGEAEQPVLPVQPETPATVEAKPTKPVVKPPIGQTEIPGTADTFNLAGENVTSAEQPPAARVDTATGELPGTTAEAKPPVEPAAKNTEQKTPETAEKSDPSVVQKYKKAIEKWLKNTDPTNDRSLENLERAANNIALEGQPKLTSDELYALKEAAGLPRNHKFTNYDDVKGFEKRNDTNHWKSEYATEAKPAVESKKPKQPNEDRNAPPPEGEPIKVKKAKSEPVVGEPVEVTEARRELKWKGMDSKTREEKSKLVRQFDADQQLAKMDPDVEIRDVSDESLDAKLTELGGKHDSGKITDIESEWLNKVYEEHELRMKEIENGRPKEGGSFSNTLKNVVLGLKQSGGGIPYVDPRIVKGLRAKGVKIFSILSGEIDALRETPDLRIGDRYNKGLFTKLNVDMKRIMDPEYRKQLQMRAESMLHDIGAAMGEEGYAEFDPANGGGMEVASLLAEGSDRINASDAENTRIPHNEWTRRYNPENAPKTAEEAIPSSVEKAVNETKNAVLPESDSDQRSYVESWADSKLKEIRNSTLDVNQLLDPEIAVALAIKGVAHAGRAAGDFAVWSKAMVNEFGNAVKPHLKAAWEKLKDLPALQSEAYAYQLARDEAGKPALDIHAAIADEALKQDAAKEVLSAAASDKTPDVSTYQKAINAGPVAFFRSVAARMRSLADINTQSPAMKQAVELFVGTPGKGEERDFLTAHSNQVKAFANRIELAMAPLKDVIKGMTVEAQAKLQEQMIKVIESGANGVGHMGDAIREIKSVMADQHAYEREAGVKVGEVNNYFHRKVNASSVIADPSGFVAAAEKAYEDKWRREAQAEASKEGLSAPEPTSKDRLNFRNQAIAWKDAIVLNKEGWNFEKNIFENTKPAGEENFQKEREFTKEEAKHFEAYRDTNIWKILASQNHTIVKRAELTRRLGADGEKYAALKQQMKNEGVSPEHVNSYEEYVKNMIGYTPPKDIGINPETSQIVMNAANLLTTLKFLAKTPLLVTTEPAGIAHHTGNTFSAPLIIGKNLVRIANIMRRATPDSIAKANSMIEQEYGPGHDVASIFAMKMGITAAHGPFMEGASGYMPEETGSNAAGKMRQIMNRIHAGMGLDVAEIAKRESGVNEGMNYMQKLVDHATGNETFTNILKKSGISSEGGMFDTTKYGIEKLKGLGVPEAEHADFADFVNGLKKMTPDQRIEAMFDKTNPMAKRYRNAVEMFTKSAVVQTTTGSRAVTANESYLGRALFMLNTYSNEYALQHKEALYNEALRLTNNDGGNTSAGERLMAFKHLAALPMTMATMYGVGQIYKAMNGQLDDKGKKAMFGIPHLPVDIVSAGFRTGISGSGLDMVWKSLEREQLPLPVVLGPLVDISKGIFDESKNPGSNAANKAVAKTAFSTGVAPAINLGLTQATAKLPLPLKPFTFAAQQLLANPQTAKTVGDEVGVGGSSQPKSAQVSKGHSNKK